MIQDNSTLANILKTFFESRSFTVDCVSNAADAMSKILRKDYDVLLCEMVTRQFRGDMFFFAVERTKPHLCGRFVFLVAQKARAESMELLRIKGSVLVKRPFRVSKLLELITEMLKGNSSKIGPEEVGSRQTTQ